MIYDVIIIGAGSAGLTASIYASRRTLKTLVISQDIGGQANTANDIENYPGFGLVSGPELMLKFQIQAKKFGAEFLSDEVIKIEKSKDKFLVKTSSKEFETLTVILASGLAHRHLDVDGEEKFIGQGISFCATCDAPLYKNKVIAVVGGGNSALDATLLLSKFCPKVYLIHRREEFTGEEIMIKQVKEAKNIELILNATVEKFEGVDRLEKMIVKNLKDNGQKELIVQGVFIEVGFIAKTDWLGNLVKLDEKKQVIINDRCETSIPGILAAGDITTIIYKQVVISAGEGAKAALSAYKYLQNKGLTRGASVDWGQIKK
jgi:thioredoxin-disulfide reductase